MAKQKLDTDKWGAVVVNGAVHFRMWAPEHNTLEVLSHKDNSKFLLQKQENGFFSGCTDKIRPGDLYSYIIDGQRSLPDPCSRFQPQGPHGPSMIVDPQHFTWRDSKWQGLSIKGQVIYELHVGTFTPEGTFEAVTGYIDELLDLGITVLEIMPVAEFAGSRNWGYDGVDLFAPTRIYGGYESFKRLVDAAHGKGMGIILDVVYNHFGPDGNYLKNFSNRFFKDSETDWGAAINFDGKGCSPVREFFIQNAEYWINDFHLDGLRFDATHGIFDNSQTHIISEIEQRARAIASGRKIILVAENEPQMARFIAKKEKGGFGLDGLWIDDFHHCARVALTGKRVAYYADYRGRPQEFVSLVKRSSLYQGQYHGRRSQPRGSSLMDEPAETVIFCLQNHDQIANSLLGKRLHQLAQPAGLRALTVLWLLAPQTPLFFMGQEFGAEEPFQFFIDHKAGLALDIVKGRKKFLAKFPDYKLYSSQKEIPDPREEETFRRCILNRNEKIRNLFNCIKI